jgi:hypothetical protein
MRSVAALPHHAYLIYLRAVLQTATGLLTLSLAHSPTHSRSPQTIRSRRQLCYYNTAVQYKHRPADVAAGCRTFRDDHVGGPAARWPGRGAPPARCLCLSLSLAGRTRHRDSPCETPRTPPFLVVAVCCTKRGRFRDASSVSRGYWH